MVPTLYRSSKSGSSVSGLIWLVTAIYLLALLAFLTSFKLDFRPIVQGMTTPGKSTMFRKGRIGISPSIVISKRLASSPSKSAISENCLLLLSIIWFKYILKKERPKRHIQPIMQKYSYFANRMFYCLLFSTFARRNSL